MRYAAGIFLTALAAAGTFLMSAAETASSPRTAFQELEIAPGQGLPFVLGDIAGVAYFTLAPSGLRLVATIGTAGDPGRTPVRFVATLQPNQAATVSAPGKTGEKSIEVSFVRQGERLIVKAPSPAGN